MGAPKRLRPALEPLRVDETTPLQGAVASEEEEEEVQAVSPRSKHRRTAAELKVCTASLVAAKESFRKCNLALQSARKALDDALALEALSGTAATKVIETQYSAIKVAETKPLDAIKVAETKPLDANIRLCQDHFIALLSGRCTDPGPHIDAILRAAREDSMHLDDQQCKSFATAARKRPLFRNANDSAVINQVQSLFVARHAACGGMPRARRRPMLASVQVVLGAPRPMCAGAGNGVAAQNAVRLAQATASAEAATSRDAAAFEEARRKQQASAARLRSEELDQRQAAAEEQDAREEVVAAGGCLQQGPAQACTSSSPLEID